MISTSGTPQYQTSATTLCNVDDLVPNSGVCAMVDGEQVAIFYLPDTETQVFALGNWDPIGRANVMSRGIVGSLGEELVVASPLYKQHYSLTTGTCLEEDAELTVFPVEIENELVVLKT